MVIQYFLCKKFVEMNPSERFRNLRNKGFCYMCLYPGAHQNSGKHSTGSCQRDYICKHPSHDRYDRRQHVLVFHEHRDTEDNKQLLETYKSKFIIQNPNVPSFSKDIKLSFISQQTFISESRSKSLELNDDGLTSENGKYLV